MQMLLQLLDQLKLNKIGKFMAKVENYETMYQELETIINSLQSGELSLDEAVKSYERSTEIIDKLEKHLKAAENSVTKIKASLK